VRVLEIVADGNPGGGTTHVLQILRGLHDSISFELVAQTGSYLLQEAKKLGISCHGVDFFYSRLNPAIPIILRRIYSIVQPHVVHIHGGRAGFFYALACIDVPALYTVHGFHLLQKPLVLRCFAIQAERFIFHRANRIVFVSQYDASLAKSLGLLKKNKPHEVIYNGIAFHDISPTKNSGSRHIGFVGRLEHQKDPMLFLDVLAHLPEYSATIVGTGSLDVLVRKEIGLRGLTKRVSMLGALSHSETLKVLSMLSVVVLSSRWEGLPLITLESMCMGVPVVSVNVSGMSEIIENGINGILVDQRSGETLANGVKKVTQDSSLRAFIIQNARSKVKEKFSGDQMLQSLRRVYQEIQ
jgi:glycosyltransferase involved in cell wall biosynthesis